MDNRILGKLPGLYWFLRYHKRNAAARRRYYRYIAKEKKMLLAAGMVDAECLRRYCRSLCKIHCGYAKRNFEVYRKECSACR